jgi:hypothetical protein
MSPVMMYLPVSSKSDTCIADSSAKQDSAMLIDECNCVTEARLRIVASEVQFLYKAHIYIKDTGLDAL